MITRDEAEGFGFQKYQRDIAGGVVHVGRSHHSDTTRHFEPSSKLGKLRLAYLTQEGDPT